MALGVVLGLMVLVGVFLLVRSMRRASSSRTEHAGVMPGTPLGATSLTKANTRATNLPEIGEPHLLVDEEFEDDVDEQQSRLVSDGQARLILLAALRTARSRYSVFGFSNSEGMSFSTRTLKEQSSKDASREELLAVFRGQRVAYALRKAIPPGRDGILYRMDVGGTATRVRMLPAIPPGQRLLAAGTPLLAFDTPDAQLAAVSVLPDGSKGTLTYFSESGESGSESAPEGRVVLAFSHRSPTLLLARTGQGNRVDVVRYQVPALGGVWQKLDTSPVPYTPDLKFEPGPELVCGVAGEEYRPELAWNGEKEAVFFAFTRDRMYPMRFERPREAELVPVCGSCVPLALQRSALGLALRVTVRRGLASDALPTAPEFDPKRDAKTGVGTCTASNVIVAYLAAGKLMVQHTQTDGGWSFQKPKLIVTPKAGERIETPMLAALGERVVLAWRRNFDNRRRFRLEFLVSEDGASTFR